MTKLEIEGTLSGLKSGIPGDAKAFGYTPQALVEQLRFIAMDYLVLERDYAASQTVRMIFRLSHTGTTVPGRSHQGDRQAIACHGRTHEARRPFRRRHAARHSRQQDIYR